VARFTASVNFDNRLYHHDIAGSIAHTSMLSDSGILSKNEASQIIEGLQNINKDIDAGEFAWSEDLEDVHMNIEAALIERIGQVGKKLHTGRSRNDQIATDIRLWLRDEIDEISRLITSLQREMINLASSEYQTIMPGFTHLQTAQPVTFGHHILAWNEMLDRDFGRLQDCRTRMNQCPLGSAALAGTSYPIDRNHTAINLGFEKATENSLDSVSDRDFAIEFCSFASVLLTHLSRMSEELILWASGQFQFVTLPDRFCTGSSIMPQKKNPDVPELVRGKTGRVHGNLISLLTLMKSQPLAYNKDNQEDKEPIFDTVDTVKDCLRAFADMVPAIQTNKKIMLEAANSGFSTATDLADYLVIKGVPFRDAHEVVGKAVAYGISENRDLAGMTLDELKMFSSDISDDVFDILTLEGSVKSRNHIGGTAPDQVKSAAERALSKIEAR
jgi:argininosuccinate lyase